MRFQLLLIAILTCLPVQAHTVDQAYLHLQAGERAIAARWSIPLRELDSVLDLDANRDQAISRRDLEHNRGRITNYAYSHILFQWGKANCDTEDQALTTEENHGAVYLVLQFSVACDVGNNPEAVLTVDYDLMLDENPLLSAVLQWNHEKKHVFTAQVRSVNLPVNIAGVSRL